MRQTNVRGTLSLRGFRKLRTGAIVATGVILLGLGFLAPTVSASEQDGVWVARTVAEVKADIQKEGDLFKYVIKWGDTLSVISEASNIPVDVLQEMNHTSGKNLFLPHNELYFTEAETISDTVTKHKIVIKESGASGEVRTYEVLLKKDQETKAVTFELTDVTEKVEKMAVNYSPVYQPVSAPVVERAEESGEELASEAPAETSPEVKEETEAPVASKAETRSETLNVPSAYTTNGSGNSTESSPAVDKAPSNTGTTNQPVASNPSSEVPVPKAEEPASPAPKVEEPATPAPKAEEPVATTPKAEEPVSPAPKVDEPAATTPKADESVSPAPKADEPATPAPKAEEPTTPAPKVDEPVSPAPKADEPVAPAPKADEPVSPAPKVEEPTATTPKADEPAASVPKADEQLAPTSKVEEPATPAPKVEEPATPAPKAEEPTTPAPKAEEPTTPAPKVEEPATPASSAPKDDESGSSVESPSTGNHSDESGTPSETPTGDSTSSLDASGEPNFTEQPAGESGKSETTSEPSNTPSAEATNDSGNTATSSPLTYGTTSNTGTTEQPETPASKPEVTTPKEDKLPTNQNGDTSNPTPAPKEDTPSEEVAPKGEKLEEAKKDGKDVIEKIAASKLSEIEKVKDEAEKAKLEAQLKELKEAGLEAINNAKDHDAAVDAADEYQTKIDEINVPGEELPAPNYNKDNLTNGHNEGTTIDNGSTAIGHGSGEATSTTPTQPTTEERPTSPVTPTQPASTSEGTASFRKAPEVQVRARRVARAVNQPDGTVNISYNYDGMPDINGFLSDPGENNTVAISNSATEDEVKELVKAKIQAKAQELAKHGYKVKEEIVFEQDTNVKNFNYVVTFTKEKIGTTGFRIAPEVQVRTKKVVKRDLSNKTKKINIYYNLTALKDIAGALGELGGENMLTFPGNTPKEELKRAIEEKTKAQIEKLKKQGFKVVSTTDLDQIVEGGDSYDYVVEFTKESKSSSANNTGFRKAPLIQKRSKRSVEQKEKVDVHIYFNLKTLPGIAGALDVDGDTTIKLPKNATEAQVKAAIQGKIAKVEKRGYKVSDFYFGAKTDRGYDFVVEFKK